MQEKERFDNSQLRQALDEVCEAHTSDNWAAIAETLAAEPVSAAPEHAAAPTGFFARVLGKAKKWTAAAAAYLRPLWWSRSGWVAKIATAAAAVVFIGVGIAVFTRPGSTPSVRPLTDTGYVNNGKQPAPDDAVILDDGTDKNGQTGDKSGQTGDPNTADKSAGDSAGAGGSGKNGTGGKQAADGTTEPTGGVEIDGLPDNADVILDGEGYWDIPTTTTTTLPRLSALPWTLRRQSIRPAKGGAALVRWSDADSTHYADFVQVLRASKVLPRYLGNRAKLLTEKVTVEVINAGKPVPGVQVQMIEKGGGLLWQTVTDHSGKATLFYGGKQPWVIKLDSGKDTSSVDFAGDVGAVTVMMDGPAVKGALDVYLVMETAPSVKPQLAALQSNMKAALTAVTSADKKLRLRTGISLYRGTTEAYAVQAASLSGGNETLVSGLKNATTAKSNAYAAVMEQALYDAVCVREWNEQAEKVLFLVADHLPPKEKAVINTLQTAVDAAVKKGIRIVGIGSPHTSEDVEQMLRALALATGGEYLYLPGDETAKTGTVPSETVLAALTSLLS